MVMNGKINLMRFRDFVELATHAIQHSTESRNEKFLEFVRKGSATLTEPAKAAIRDLKPLAARARPWLIKHDILKIAG